MGRKQPYRCKRTNRSKSLKKFNAKKRESKTHSFDASVKSNEAFDRLLEGPSFQHELNSPEKTTDSPEEPMDISSDDDNSADFKLIEEPAIECEEEATISGRRIVDINHMLKQLEHVASHSKQCTMGKYKFNREIVCGLSSKFVYHCDNCDTEFEISSQPAERKDEINDALVWGALSIGIGFSQVQELFSILDIPIMGPKKFRSNEMKIEKVWEETLISKMKQNAAEERRLAIQKGNFLNGIPYISVIGDGGWAKRSYGHGMNSASGVGLLIGAETKKILFLGVRNKFCYVCSKAKVNKCEPSEHQCYVNYHGPSTGMESNVIVEGFKRSEKDYGLIYKYYIGDGDSSVFARIQEGCRYGRFVVKVECANHMTRAFSDNLHKLSSNTKYPLESRRFLTEVPQGKTVSRLERLVKGVRTAIKEAGLTRNLQDTENLRQELKNAPSHVFGDHGLCRESFCKLKTGSEKNVLIDIDCSFLAEIHKLIDKLVRRADSLVLNATTNCAERYMGLVSKLTGGKRINFSSRGSYNRRCHAAGLSHSSGPSWHFSPWKKLYGRSPGKYFKHRLQEREKVRARRALFSEEKPRMTKRKGSGYDMEYGPSAIEPDIEESVMKGKIEDTLKMLKNDSENWKEIERSTVGQSNNPLWREKRMNRLTASMFGSVIKRLDHTPCHNLVKRILYPRELNTASVVYGRLNEKKAIERYEETTTNKVEECGLFCSEEFPYLGASPDGLVGDDGIVEIKCLPSITGDLKNAALGKKKNFCLEIDRSNHLKLKRRHSYYFQIQGQLNITKRTWCDLIIYTENELLTERINSDVHLWRNVMLPKLVRFYKECILPEIVDSRIVRQLRVRDPPFILEARERRESEQEKK